jgi:hypothetical protein
MYPCGVALTPLQQKEIEAFSEDEKDDARFIATLMQISFGTEVLATSSITGLSKSAATISKLNEKRLEFVKRKYYIFLFFKLLFVINFIFFQSCFWTVYETSKMRTCGPSVSTSSWDVKLET